MDIEVKIDDWTVGTLIQLQNASLLVVNREYQRGLRWSDLQKRMFIDSIFRGYSIPAFYFHKKQTSIDKISIQNTRFEIVDGQQRIDAVYSYSEGAFALYDPSEDTGFRFPNFVKDVPCPWGGKRFEELSEDLQEKLKAQKVVVYEITTENENSIRDLFIRLQGGTPLTPQDKRDSWPGSFTEFVLRIGGKSGVDRWYGFPLFKNISNESRRRQLVAQVFMLFWTITNEMKFCSIKSADIDEFYHAHVDFDSKSSDAKRFEKICKTLGQILDGKPRIVGHYIIHCCLFIDSLMKEYAPGWEIHLAENLFEFERRRREAAKCERRREVTEYRRYYTEYGQLTQTRSDDADTIRRRHAFFSEEMLKLLSPKQLDPKRSFSDLERKTVFFRDREICQWCRMNGNSSRVSWDESDIHHVIPHGHGGSTDVENAALVHRDCHPKSREDVERFRDWWHEFGGSVDDTGNVRRRVRGRPFPPPDGTKARFRYGDRTHLGEIREGKLVLDKDSMEFGSFSEASVKITGTQRNGWRDWQIKLAGEDVWISADEWRTGN